MKFSDEKNKALALAEKILEDSSRDPDGDLSVLARQLLRAYDREYRTKSVYEMLRLVKTPRWPPL